MRDFAQLGQKLRAARQDLTHHSFGAYEGGHLPGAINAATRIRTARAAVNDLSAETLADFLGDTLTARFGKVKASLILRDALAGVEK